jgi:multidrug efflux pump subunit AcrA (membrane-fusion protein)
MERRQLVMEDRSQLDSIRSRKATVRSILESTRKLFQKSGAVSEEEVKKLELEYEETSARERELTAQEAREKVEYEMAREKKRQRILTAPISGVVTELRTDVGQRAGPGEPVARMVDPKHCRLLLNLDEASARQLKSGGEIKIEVQAGEGWIEKSGRLVSVSPVADPASRLVRVRIEFDNLDARIWPGVAGRIRLAGP